MSKTISVALKAHYAQGSNTLAKCWKATRRDGFVLAVTTCSRSLLIDGVIYEPQDGFLPKSLSQDASLAVANTEVDGMLSDDVTELDFANGVWDGCEVEAFEVNYRDLSMGKLSMGVRTMGDLKAGRTAFNAELRGLTQSLQKSAGRLVQKNCPYRFGDPDTCKVDLGPLTVTGSLTSVTDLRTFTDSSRGEAADTFGGGVITFTSGANEGTELEVYSFAAGGQIVTHLQLNANPAVGDTYSMVPGCRKDFIVDCTNRYANGPNFGGFPYVPGSDKILGLG